jgi:hypothetical protein
VRGPSPWAPGSNDAPRGHRRRDFDNANANQEEDDDPHL